MTPLVFQDGAGNNFTGIDADDPFKAESVIADTTPPELLSFDYLAAGDRPGVVLILYFSEVIDITTLNASAFTLQSTEDGSEQSFTLTGGDYIMQDASTVQLNITDEDFLLIQQQSVLAKTENATYLSFTAQAVSDVLSYSIVAIGSDNAQKVARHSVDLDSPILLAFTFDLDSGEIVLTFDEQVDINTYNASQFTLQSSANDSDIYLTLTGGIETVKAVDRTLVIDITPNDLDELNRDFDIASGIDNTFLSITSEAIGDVANNPVVPISSDDAQQASVFTDDETGPQLLSFTYNLDTQSIVLTFSETVDAETLNTSAITLSNDAVSLTESYTLTGGAYSLLDSSFIHINLTDSDIFGVTSMLNLGTNVNNTFISFTSNFAEDVYGNRMTEVPITNAIKASAVDEDTIRPTLTEFMIDVDEGNLTLTFDEVVDPNSFMASELTLQDADAFADQSFSPSNSTSASEPSDILIINLSANDLNEIKVRQICLTSTECFITYSSDVITDSFGNKVYSRHSNLGLPVGTHIRDSTPPTLLSFVSFDLSKAEFVLEFSETVDVTSVVYTGITLQSFHSLPEDVLSLSDGTISESDSEITITMSTADAISLKVNAFLCARKGTCYVTLSAEAIDDMSGNDVEAVTVGVIVNNFIPDEIGPLLDSFELDMNTGILKLTFDEIVDTTELNPSGISIAGSTDGTPSYRIISAEQTSVTYSDTVELQLSDNDINGIKAASLAVTDAFINIDVTTVIDLSPDSNQAQKVVGLEASTFVPDSEAPSLENVHLDMTKNALLLTFSEPINIDDIELVGFSLHSAESGGVSFTLTDGVIQTRELKTVVEIFFSSEDLLSFKYNGTIATSKPTSYYSISPIAIQDIAGKFLPEVTRENVDQYTADQDTIALTEFVFDIFNGIITLTFDDIANASTLVVGGITIQNAQTATINGSYTLTNSFTDSEDGLVIEIILSSTDRQNLTGIAGLATRIENTYITLDSTTIKDYTGGKINEIVDGDALQASEFIGGGNGTQLSSFNLDMNSGELELFFNQAVDAESYRADLITLQDSTGAINITLSGGTAQAQSGGFTVVVTLLPEDVELLKAEEGLANSPSDTYIFLQVLSFVDSIGGNVSTPDALPATTVIADEADPSLETFFQLDLDSGLIHLNFSETIIVSSILLDEATILNNGETLLQLTGGEIVSENSPDISFKLSDNDLDTIKDGIDVDMTVSIVVTSAFARDAFGNSLVPTTEDAVEIVKDTTPPTLDYITLDLDEGRIIFNFSEIMLVEDDKFSAFPFSLVDDTSTITIALEFSTVETTVNSRQVIINLSSDVFTSIQQNETIGNNVNDTFIIVSSPSDVLDLSESGNQLEEITSDNPLQVNQVIPDEENPVLDSFTLNLNDATLTLTFSEVVRVTTLDISLFAFQESASNPEFNVQLTSATALKTGNAKILEFDIGNEDFDRIRTNPYLGVYKNNTFINVTVGAIKDMYNNEILSVHGAVEAGEVVPDDSVPVLEDFEVDMNTGELILTYSETIDVDLFDVTRITLYNTSSLTPSFDLTSSTSIISESASIVVVQLGLDDLNPLRAAMNFGSNEENTYITIMADTAFDFAGNPAIGLDSPTKADNVTQDNTGPSLYEFVLNLNTGTLYLTFAETIIENTFNSSLLMLQNAQNDAIQYVAITSEDYVLENYSVIVITLNSDDIDEINLRSTLATDINNTFLSYMQSVAEDVLGNRAPAVSAEDAKQASSYIKDQARPNTTEFSIDLNSFMLKISFNEVVDPTSLDMSLLSLHSEQESSLNFTFTNYTSIVQSRRTLIITMKPEDINELNSLDICTSINDCFLAGKSGFVSDTAGNPVFPLEEIQAVNFTEDSIPPEFTQFVIMDFDMGIMILSFSETIDAEKVDVSKVRLQNNHNGEGVDFFMYSLTDSYTVGGSGDEIEIQFSETDLNRLKQERLNDVLCTRRTDCFIRYSPGFGSDAFGNNLTAITNTIESDSRHYPLMILTDQTGPIVTHFDLLLETGEISLTFDELIDSTSFEEAGIVLQDSTSSSSTYTITSAEDVSLTDTAVSFSLVEIDRLSIKGDPFIATSSSTTYLTNTENLISDIFGNPAQIRADEINALLVSNFETDSTNPVYESFQVFNRESMELTLKFSEPISSLTINYASILLQSEQDGGEILNITTATAAVDPNDPTQLVITLSLDDQFTLKNGSTIGSTKGTTYLIFDDNTFFDPAGNPSNGITVAEIPTVFLEDLQLPQLAGFEINFQDSLLVLTYDDIINPQIYNPLGITIQDSDMITDNTYQLTGGVSLNTNNLGFTITATIISFDLVRLKHQIGLASSIDNSYIAATTTVTEAPSGRIGSCHNITSYSSNQFYWR